MGENRVKFLWAEGDDVCEFADLAGTTGVMIDRGNGRLTYMPDGRGDWLQMNVRGKSVDADGRERITTSLGNVFVFRNCG